MPGCYTRPPTFPSDPVCTFPVTLSGSRTPETLHSRVDGLNKANPSMPTRKTIDRSRSTSPSGKTSASSGLPPAPRGLCCCSPSRANRCSSARILKVIRRGLRGQDVVVMFGSGSGAGNESTLESSSEIPAIARWGDLRMSSALHALPGRAELCGAHPRSALFRVVRPGRTSRPRRNLSPYAARSRTR